MPVSFRSRLTAVLAFVAVSFGLVLASAGTAAAAPYPVPTANGPTLSVSFSGPLVAGAPLTISITGFQPFESTTIVIFSDPVNVGTYAEDANGSLTVTVPLPAGLDPGPHTVVATGANGSVAQAGFSISSGLAFTGEGQGTGGTATGTGGSGLAFTGIAIGASLVLALGLLTAGTVTLMAGRRQAS